MFFFIYFLVSVEILIARFFLLFVIRTRMNLNANTVVMTALIWKLAKTRNGILIIFSKQGRSAMPSNFRGMGKSCSNVTQFPFSNNIVTALGFFNTHSIFQDRSFRQ